MTPTAATQRPSFKQRARIVTAARRQFFAHGFRPVTMDDLAITLGMSKKTMYACFPSKASLVKAVLQQKFQGIDEDLRHITSRLASDRSNVAAVLRDLLACLQRHTEEIQPPFVRDMGREAPDLFHIVESRRRSMIRRYFGKLFRAGRKQGLFRRDVSPQVMIDVLLGATQAIMNPAKMAELGLTPKTGYSIILSIILEGLLNPIQGRKATS